MAGQLDGHRYRLELSADGKTEAIEFNADNSDMALGMTRRFSGGRSVSMFEDGHKLADLRFEHGFWRVT